MFDTFDPHELEHIGRKTIYHKFERVRVRVDIMRGTHWNFNGSLRITCLVLEGEDCFKEIDFSPDQLGLPHDSDYRDRLREIAEDNDFW